LHDAVDRQICHYRHQNIFHRGHNEAITWSLFVLCYIRLPWLRPVPITGDSIGIVAPPVRFSRSRLSRQWRMFEAARLAPVVVLCCLRAPIQVRLWNLALVRAPDPGPGNMTLPRRPIAAVAHQPGSDKCNLPSLHLSAIEPTRRN
jgi:hypothetical protein